MTGLDVRPASQPPAGRTNGPLWIALVVLVGVVVVLGVALVTRGNQPSVRQAAAVSSPVPVYPTPVGSYAGTPSPTPTTEVVGLGTPVPLSSEDGALWADIVVAHASQHASYGSWETPAPGHVYIQAFVTYTAYQDGVDYNPFDFQVFVDGVAVDNMSSVAGGPQPELHSGTLSKGRKAQGWVVYEVPIRGKVVMSYGNRFSDEPPVFDVVIRAN